MSAERWKLSKPKQQTISLRVIVASRLQLKRLQATKSLLDAEIKHPQEATDDNPLLISLGQHVIALISSFCSLATRRNYKNLSQSSDHHVDIKVDVRLHKLEELMHEWSGIFPFTNYDLVWVTIQHGTGTSSNGYCAKNVRLHLTKSTFSLADHSSAYYSDPQCRIWLSKRGRNNVAKVLNLLLECHTLDSATK